MLIYVVRKPFRSNGITYEAGSVVTEPDLIKRFKAKVSEGKVIALDRGCKHTIPTLKFYEQKLGVEIIPCVKDYLAVCDEAEEAAKIALELAEEEQIAQAALEAKAEEEEDMLRLKALAKQIKAEEAKATKAVTATKK